MVVVAILLQTICAPLFIKWIYNCTWTHFKTRNEKTNRKADLVLYSILSVLAGVFAIYMDFYIWLHPQELTKFYLLIMLSVDVIFALKILYKKIKLLYKAIVTVSTVYCAILGCILYMVMKAAFQTGINQFVYVICFILLCLNFFSLFDND